MSNIEEVELGGLFAVVYNEIAKVEESISEVITTQIEITNDTKLDNLDLDTNINGKVARFEANIEAIKLIKREDNHYTKEELQKIALYSGFGGLVEPFEKSLSPKWQSRREELLTLLDADELKSVESGVLDAYYTPDNMVKFMWSIASHLGFKGGNVLEPSFGTGRFMFLSPIEVKPKSAFSGYEIDKISHGVAKTLFPKASLFHKGFESDYVCENSTLVIGNPPYGDFKIKDKTTNKYDSLKIHNHFIVKSLDSLSEGGVLIFIVTSSFLDNINSKVVDLIDSSSDFVGAIRVPNDLFSATNTKITTDIVIFRKRKINIFKKREIQEDAEVEQERDLVWSERVDFKSQHINRYFHENPEMILGELREGYRGVEVVSNGDMEVQLKDTLKKLPKNIITASSHISKGEGLGEFGDAGSVWVEDAKALVVIQEKFNKDIFVISDAKIAVERVEGMVGIRDTLLKLIEAQNEESLSSEAVESIREELNSLYDAFKAKYGFLNNQVNQRLFKYDNLSELVLALEKDYDKGISKGVAKEKGVVEVMPSATKADILLRNTIKAKKSEYTDSSDDALILSLNNRGCVDIEYMSSISSKSEEEIKEDLKGEIFFDEKLGYYVTKDIFLSGDVKDKIDYTTDSYSKDELIKIAPKDLTASQITPSIGSSWISKEIIEEYASKELGFYHIKVEYLEFSSKWYVSGYGSRKYQTDRRDGAKILQAALNSTFIRIMDRGADDKLYLNVYESELANSQKDELREDFLRWVFSDPKRRKALVGKYNDLFNRYVSFSESDIMDKYTPQGLSDAFIPRVHQIRSTYKAVFNNAPMVLNHKVGSGKSLEAQMIAIELKRQGKANKPMIITLKSVLPDFVRDFKRAYPNASILAPNDSDFTKDKRAKLLSKIATGDFDCIVFTHEQLQAIENPKEFEIELMKMEIREAIESKSDASKSGLGVKDIENIIKKMEFKLESLKSRKDDTLNFADLSIDSIIVDESHMFKKLFYNSSLNRIAGMPEQKGSKRAYDLFIKTQYILKKLNKSNVFFLSGTVITNTIPEIYLVQKYLQHDELQRQGLRTFDEWARNYTEIVTDIEITASGKFKEKARMSEFKNITSLMSMVGNIIDTVTNKDIEKSDENFKIPKLKGGKPTLVFVEPSDEQMQYIGVEDERGNYNEDCLVYRSEHMPSDGSDNHLKLFSDAGKCAIDMRLIDESFSDHENSKINTVVKNAFDKYKEFDEVKGTQIIFCDTGVPKSNTEKRELQNLLLKAENGDKLAKYELNAYSNGEIDYILNGGDFSIYEDIKEKLVLRGIKRGEIAFIHDYSSKAKKLELSELMANGEIRILLGSTRKAGTGLNVQKKLVAVHHIDIPYMPSDIEQRNGRIERQGNMFIEFISNFEIEIFYYATKKTLDAVRWQMIERKAKFIEDFMSGCLEGSTEQIDHSTSELSEMMKAEASGNQLLLKKMKLSREIKKLERLKSAFILSSQEQKERVEFINEFIPKKEASLEIAKSELRSATESKVVILGIELSNSNRKSLAKELKEFVVSKLSNRYEKFKVGSYGEIDIRLNVSGVGIELAIDGEYNYNKIFTVGSRGDSLINFFEDIPNRYESEIENTILLINVYKNELEHNSNEDRLFAHENRLSGLHEELNIILEEIKDKATKKEDDSEEIKEVA